MIFKKTRANLADKVSLSQERFEMIRTSAGDRYEEARFNATATVQENVRQEKPIVVWSLTRTASIMLVFGGVVGLLLNLLRGFSEMQTTTMVLLPAMIVVGILGWRVCNSRIRETRDRLDLGDYNYQRHENTTRRRQKHEGRTSVPKRFTNLVTARKPDDLDEIESRMAGVSTVSDDDEDDIDADDNGVEDDTIDIEAVLAEDAASRRKRRWR